MAKKAKLKSFDEAVTWFRGNGFDVTEPAGTSGRVFLRKYNASAAIERAEDGGVKIFAFPGYVVAGERRHGRHQSVQRVFGYGQYGIQLRSRSGSQPA